MSNPIFNKAENFQRSIEMMQKDLQRLADQNKVSDAFIQKQNRILKHLIAYYNASEDLIDNLYDQLVATNIENSKRRQQLTDRIIQFEAICILHGILDFPRFLSYPKQTLVDWATDLYHDEKGFMLSDRLKEYIADLPIPDRNAIESILFKRINSRIQSYLQYMQASI